jgi:hypothetical protein
MDSHGRWASEAPARLHSVERPSHPCGAHPRRRCQGMTGSLSPEAPLRRARLGNGFVDGLGQSSRCPGLNLPGTEGMSSVRLLSDELTFKEVVMLTPAKYWRVSRTLEAMRVAPARSFVLPHALAAQSKPPIAGHGILLADYVESDETGLVRYLGLVTSRGSEDVTVDWRPVEAAIWVDTDTGRRYWQQPGGFGFASSKVAGYGLHQLFADAFPHLEVRELSSDIQN